MENNGEVHSLSVERTCDINALSNLLTAHKVFISSALPDASAIVETSTNISHLQDDES